MRALHMTDSPLLPLRVQPVNTGVRYDVPMHEHLPHFVLSARDCVANTGRARSQHREDNITRMPYDLRLMCRAAASVFVYSAA